MRRCLFLSLALVAGFLVAHAQHSTGCEVDSLIQEIARLEKEVAHLKVEAQQLRRMLTQAPMETVRAQRHTPQAKTKSAPPGIETGFWLSKSSNKRHNRNCRYYKASAGRFCNQKEGVACGACGG